jgi:circadian clock protein KaiB
MPEKYLLKLYVLGRTPLSITAEENIRKICEQELKGAHQLKVIDLTNNVQLAEDERIFATPTLERSSPRPLKRLVGDLSDAQKVLAGLDIVRK